MKIKKFLRSPRLKSRGLFELLDAQDANSTLKHEVFAKHLDISKTKIKSHLRKKTNPEIKETILAALKNPAWNKIAKIVSSSTRSQSSINLFQIDNQTTAGDTVIILGKVLSKGKLTKKVRICALAISQTAKEKLKPTKSEFGTLLEEINKNKKAESLKIKK